MVSPRSLEFKSPRHGASFTSLFLSFSLLWLARAQTTTSLSLSCLRLRSYNSHRQRRERESEREGSGLTFSCKHFANRNNNSRTSPREYVYMRMSVCIRVCVSVWAPVEGTIRTRLPSPYVGVSGERTIRPGLYVTLRRSPASSGNTIPGVSFSLALFRLFFASLSFSHIDRCCIYIRSLRRGAVFSPTATPLNFRSDRVKFTSCLIPF